MNGSLAFRVLLLLTALSLALGIALFYLQATSYLIVLAVSTLLALGALCAATLERGSTRRI